MDGQDLERNRIGRLVTSKSWKEVSGWTSPNGQRQNFYVPCGCPQRATTAEGAFNNKVDKMLSYVDIRQSLYLATAVLALWAGDQRGHGNRETGSGNN